MMKMKNQVFIALLAILVFFTACGEEGEDKEVKYYKDRVKAESKVKWCAKKMDYPFEEIEKSIEANTIASRSKIYDIIDKAYSEKKLDNINRTNCETAYTSLFND